MHLLFLVSVNLMLFNPPDMEKRLDAAFLFRQVISFADSLTIPALDALAVAQDGKKKKKAKKAHKTRKASKESKDGEVEKDLLLKDNEPVERSKAKPPKNKKDPGIDDREALVEWDPLLGSGERSEVGEKQKVSKRKQRTRTKRLGNKDDAVEADPLLGEVDVPKKGKKEKKSSKKKKENRSN